MILGGEVAIEAALELAIARLRGLFQDLAAREDVVELRAVSAHDGVHVVGGLHAPLELQRMRPGVEQTGQHVGRAGVTRAERSLAPGLGPGATRFINELVGQPTGLRAHAAVSRAPSGGEAGKEANARVAKADGAVGEHLELDVHRVVDRGDLVNRKLAGERDAVRTCDLAPGGSAGA